MSEQQAAERILQLRHEIERHNRLYYVEALPQIADREYDALMLELIALEQQYPQFQTSDSPSLKVGGEPISGFNTVPHRIPMLSIDNVFEIPGIVEFDNRVRKLLAVDAVDYTLEYKIDGVALAVIYEQGKLVQAVTRGDGRQGDEITSNARTVRGIPLNLSGKTFPERLEIRGEAYISNSDFAILRAEQERRGETLFANPRNSTAGALKLLDPKLCAQRKVRFVAHGIGDYSAFAVTRHEQFLKQLQEFGVPVTPGLRVCQGIQEVLDQAQLMMDDIHSLDMEVDGLVIKVNRLDWRDELGVTSKSPRWVVAYKWERYEAVTQVQEIQIQVGKTGTLTPVAYLLPVEIAGTTVSRSSLHNRDEMQRLDVKIGDWVVVEKAGKIIPHVLRVELERRPEDVLPFVFPEHCPICSTAVQQDEGGVYIRCPNPACPARLRESLRFFASRQAMDIEGLGSKLIEQLVDRGFLKSLADIYRLSGRKAELISLERMGTRSVENLLAGIERSKEQPLWRLLTGLNIRHVGVNNARILADHYHTLEALQAQTPETLATVNEIGVVIAQSVHEFLNSEFGCSLIEQLKQLGVNTGQLPAVADTGEHGKARPLEGKTLVVTGTLAHYTRQGIQELIHELGGKPAGSVSKNTHYVITGENPGSKVEKAEKLGIPVLTEAQFQQMLEEER